MTMPRKYDLPRTKKLVYNLVARNMPEPTITSDVIKEIKCSPAYASRLLGDLTRNEYLRRTQRLGHSYDYTLGPRKPTMRANTPIVEAIGPNTMREFLLLWSESTWQPKIYDTARNLPYVVARLFELATEVAYGSVVKKEDLGELKLNLNDFYKALEQTSKVVKGVLETGDLWDVTKFAPYLLQDTAPDDLKALAQKVKNNN